MKKMMLLFITWGIFYVFIPYSFAANPQVAAGDSHTVGLTINGTVLTTGSNAYRQFDVSDWEAIKQVAIGTTHTVGLKTDGTVISAGSNGYGQGDVSSWSNIRQIYAGANVTIGLLTDGTLVGTGENGYSQLNISDWEDVVQVAIGTNHTVGLKSDGTVVAVGQNSFRQLAVSSWTGITQVAAGEALTLGLKEDGTVVAAGKNEFGQANVSSWRDVSQVATGASISIGVKSNGSVLVTGRSLYGEGNVSSWKDIYQVKIGTDHTVGLKTDGSVVATGRNTYRQTSVSDWDLGTPSDTPDSGLTRTQVSQLYVAIFGRASEGEGNDYWAITRNTMVDAAQTMLETDAAKTYFGTTLDDNQLFIAFIYENTLGKTVDEDPEGISYWVSQLDSGKSKAEVAVALIDAVMDEAYDGLPAQDQFINRVAVSDYTAANIDTVSDPDDLSFFSQLISSITDDEDTVTAAESQIDEFI